MSGVTFFTLGYGDVTPLDGLGQVLAVMEAGIGFGFIAVVISYLPTLVSSLFHNASGQIRPARRPGRLAPHGHRAAGAPGRRRPHFPTSTISCRNGNSWSADLVGEPPVVSRARAFTARSTKTNRGWPRMTMILDTCSLILVGVKEADRYQAQLTFAMARHAAVDLALVMWVPPTPVPYDRLPPEQLAEIAGKAASGRLPAPATWPWPRKNWPSCGPCTSRWSMDCRSWLLFNIPSFFPDKPIVDNWQTSPWSKRTPGIGNLPTVGHGTFRLRAVDAALGQSRPRGSVRCTLATPLLATPTTTPPSAQ